MLSRASQTATATAIYRRTTTARNPYDYLGDLPPPNILAELGATAPKHVQVWPTYAPGNWLVAIDYPRRPYQSLLLALPRLPRWHGIHGEYRLGYSPIAAQWLEDNREELRRRFDLLFTFTSPKGY